jgi:crossover junction endodeoxyribonuclease RuvC
MPTEPLGSAGKKRQVSGTGLMEILSPYCAPTIFLEQVHSMPEQGVSSSFNFGMGYGITHAVSDLCGDLNLVTPQKWKKAAGLIRKKKDAARILAQELWPYAEYT